MENRVSDLQLSIMQEFFKIRMTQAYSNGWKTEVKTVVENKFATNDSHRQNYQGVYNVLTQEGIETLDEKRMDITCLSSLLLYDFYNQCKVGSNFDKHIKAIQKDKNNLVSHISNHNDVLNVKILELTTVKDLRNFVLYLRNSNWAYPGKHSLLDKYQERIEEITAQIFQEVAGEDQEAVEFESNRQYYLGKLIGERSENAKEYIPLSYKIDDGTSKRSNLEEMLSSPTNKQGFVIFSKEAGYGNTWSIQELAGLCADRFLSDADGKEVTPILIRMGELAVSEEPIVKAVQEIFYPGSDSVENARKFIDHEPVILFVDGMDEADKENKESVRRELNKLLSSAKDICIIGGTRESDKQCYPAALPRYLICDLSDMQVNAFIDKMISDETQRKTAKYDYFENPNTSFLKNLRSPFYLKCFIDFVKEGEVSPDSDTDMMNRCIDKMIEREIDQKGFKATVTLINDYLAKLSELIGNERRYMPEQEALKTLKEELEYDTEAYASVVQIKDTLIELQLLKEVIVGRNPALLGFWHEKYKSLFSPVALDGSLWDW